MSNLIKLEGGFSTVVINPSQISHIEVGNSDWDADGKNIGSVIWMVNGRSIEVGKLMPVDLAELIKTKGEE